MSEKLMPIAWHPKRMWNFCMSENKKKDFGIKCFKIYIRKYLKQFSTQRLDVVQNVLIPSSPKIL